MFKKGLFALFFVFVFFVLSAKAASATEGTIEMGSLTNEPYRCWASSVQLQDGSFTLAFSCVNLIYPAGQQLFSYIAWTQPTDGGAPVKIGVLNLGKAQYSTKLPFNTIFITTEQNNNVSLPTGQTVMRGSVQPITFLQSPQSAPTVDEDGEVLPTPVPEQEKLSTAERISTALKRAGIASLIAIFALMGLVFVITRSRG